MPELQGAQPIRRSLREVPFELPANGVDRRRQCAFGGLPELRQAPHKFIELEKLHNFLEDWTQNSGALQEETANLLQNNFLNEGLRAWDVTRPPRYFGFEIPDFPGNYWYVWFDAPIGYMASTKQWCDRNGEKFDDWWKF